VAHARDYWNWSETLANDPFSHTDGHGLGAMGRFQLGQDMRNVRLDGFAAEQ
jgi:hypothetical protein